MTKEELAKEMYNTFNKEVKSYTTIASYLLENYHMIKKDVKLIEGIISYYADDVITHPIPLLGNHDFEDIANGNQGKYARLFISEDK